MSVQIQLRRDTAAAWTSANPTLADGELGLETDTHKIKFGDGATAWNSLAYYASGGAPSGAAGGDLSGTYPNPSVTDDSHNHHVSTLPDVDTDSTLAANSDSKIPSQKAVKTYVATAVTGLLEFKGSTDCSASPNYPAASKGDAYVVTVAGKIGGASGKSVDVGDMYLAIADNAGGTEASVGTSWVVLEHNLVGAVLSGSSAGGDLTGTYPNPTVTTNAITYAKMQDISATARILGRATAGAGDPEEITAAQALAFLLTTRGDIAVRDATTAIRLALGASGTILRSDGTDAAWATMAVAIGSLITTRGDLLTRDATTVVRKAIGTAYQRLVSDGTDPQWASFKGWELARSTNQAIAANTDTAITWPTETTDTDAWHVANASAITVPAGMGGWYTITAYVDFSADATGARYCWLGKNGAATVLSKQHGTSGGSQRELAVSWVGKLAAGDTVEVYVNTVGGTPNVNPALFTGIFHGL